MHTVASVFCCLIGREVNSAPDIALVPPTAPAAPTLPHYYGFAMLPVLRRSRPRLERCQNDCTLGPSARFISHLTSTSIGRRKPLLPPPSSFSESLCVSSITPPYCEEVEEEVVNNTDYELGKARRQARFDKEGEYRVYRELLEGKKTRFVSRVMYDGTNYKGFQLQDNGKRTVQGVLEKALSTRFQTYVPVVAAGRTDSGVHAIGQTVHFDLPNANEDLGKLTYSMNNMMPEDVRVWNMAVAPPSAPWQLEKGWPWSAMLNARGKRYTYRLFVGPIQSPIDRLYRAHASQAARSPIDVDLLYRTIPKFVGEHDFAGFSNEVEKREALKKGDGLGEFNTVRTVYSAEIIDEGGGNIRLEFHLDGALYRMVRNMVGTLLAVAARRLEPESVDEIFRTRNRDSRLVYAAPAHGLTLETVLYDDYV